MGVGNQTRTIEMRFSFSLILICSTMPYIQRYKIIFFSKYREIESWKINTQIVLFIYSEINV